MKKDIKWKFLKHNGIVNRKYKVSNQGDIVHSKGMILLKQHDMYKKSVLNGSDYKCVYISSRKNPIRVHRIVCETFHGQPPAGKNVVAHYDDVKDNNISSNLMWVSSSENVKAYYKNNSPRRYSSAKISQVKKLINKGWTNDRIAQKIPMSDSNVSAIKLGYVHVDIKPYSKFQP